MLEDLMAIAIEAIEERNFGWFAIGTAAVLVVLAVLRFAQ